MPIVGEFDRTCALVSCIVGPETRSVRRNRHCAGARRRYALDLLWELIELHPSILELVDDSSGHAGDVFTGPAMIWDPWPNE